MTHPMVNKLILWKAQLQEWEDSVPLTLKEVRKLLNSSIENNEYRTTLLEHVHSLNRHKPDGAFYLCGKAEGGYRNMGFRYGLEPHEYVSGFIKTGLWEYA